MSAFILLLLLAYSTGTACNVLPTPITALLQDDLNPRNGANSNDSSRRPLIYVYDFGPRFYGYREGESMSVSNPNYALVQLFPKLLLRAPHHITDKPEEADFFFLRAWPNYPVSLDRMVRKMRDVGPWWDRNRGRDHIVMWPNDEGRCNFQQPNVILLSHFGLLSNLHGVCDLTKKWGGACDSTLHHPLEKSPCHRPGQDIVVPPCLLEFRPDVPAHQYTSTTPFTHVENAQRARQPKAFLLFHGGQVDPREKIPPGHEHVPHFQKLLSPFESLSYSFGARQTVARLFDNVPGFAILHKDLGNYSAYLESSTFCLATAGSGWSSRYKVAITHGCIPVIVQDEAFVEWEEILPIKEYAIRVPMWMVHRLDEILHEFVKQGIAAKMQKVIACVWRLHWWRRPYGRAFEMVMCELKRRALRAPSIDIDLHNCTLKCGDDKVVDLRAAFNNI